MYVCIVLDFIISMMSMMSIMIIMFIITIIMIIIIILMILIVIILYIYIYTVYIPNIKENISGFLTTKKGWSIGRFHPGRLQLGILPTYVNVDLASLVIPGWSPSEAPVR